VQALATHPAVAWREPERPHASSLTRSHPTVDLKEVCLGCEIVATFSAMKKSVLGIAGCLGVLLIGALIIGAMLAATYNRLVRGSQEVDSRWAQVQNVYQRRADLIPNLVNTVKGAANFEQTTLNQVVQARASVGQVAVNPNQAPTNVAELERYQQAQSQLSSALSRLLVVVERYPDLKANANFVNLQAQLEGTENRISVERGRFNEAVQGYNTTLKRFPTVLFAGLFGFKEKPYFTASTGAERPPAVEFNFGAPAAPAKP
jgi:LemA protein